MMEKKKLGRTAEKKLGRPIEEEVGREGGRRRRVAPSMAGAGADVGDGGDVAWREGCWGRSSLTVVGSERWDGGEKKEDGHSGQRGCQEWRRHLGHGRM